jgi:hypothetical protein
MHLRTAALLYGAALFFWLQVEDNSVAPVIGFAFAGSALLVASRAWRWVAASRSAARGVVVSMLAGMAVGLLTALAASLLMVLKTGLHSHLYPDYLPAQIIAVLQRAPAWMAAGTLGGLGVGIAWRAVRRPLTPGPSPTQAGRGQ